jgi:phospholipid/cholesterol/gamma-HCH transport system permease protein
MREVIEAGLARAVAWMKEFIQGLGDFATFAFRSTFSGLRHPLRPAEMMEYFDTFGVKSNPVVIFAGFFAGLSICLFMEAELDQYGAKITIGRVIAVTAIRELGPLVVALMITGRVGAYIAAELGSMRISNQVDAIIALGQDPERKLASPRIWALTLIMPVITVISIISTLLGGWAASTVGFRMFWYQAQMAVYMRHLASGMMKPFVFGWLIATIACYYGLRTEAGVRGVGAAVSRTVVLCCVLVFISNAVMGMMLLNFGF